MKSILSFLAGLVVGAGLIIAIGYISNNQAAGPDNGITLFENEGESIGSESRYKVIQVVDGGALAIEIFDEFWMPTELAVLFWDESGNGFYDNQVITVPKGQCLRQLGLYRYINKDNIPKTVPVVAIRNK
jgi:hypothetical protein